LARLNAKLFTDFLHNQGPSLSRKDQEISLALASDSFQTLSPLYSTPTIFSSAIVRFQLQCSGYYISFCESFFPAFFHNFFTHELGMAKYYGLFSALNSKTKEEDEVEPIINNPDWSSPKKDINFFHWNEDKWEKVLLGSKLNEY
jgi:hypothetical protein